jgi:hypothetical protein
MGGGIMNTNTCTRSLFFAPKLWEPRIDLPRLQDLAKGVQVGLADAQHPAAWQG